MSKLPIEYLRHILQECVFITGVVADRNLTPEGFAQDEVLKRAITRSLEIIGEASKQIPADIKLKWSNVPWRNIAGMRDKLIHDYIGINYAIVWDVIRYKIPEIKPLIEDIIEREDRV